MSRSYTTGDLAKLAGVSVRTVQYYDKRGILSPSDLTEGGRRIYVDSDLEQLRMICFLRELDFSIEQIKRLFAEENAAQVLELLLVDHIATAKEDLGAKEQQVDIAVKILDRLRKQDPQSLDFLMDISLSMKNQKAWKKRFITLIVCLTVETLLFVGGAYFLQLTVWKYLLIPVFLLVLLGALYWYYQNICYLCPSCHQTFEAKWTEFALAGHTPRTRKLTCPHCHQKSYCLELVKEDTVSRDKH